jgi:hypothetical protein
MKATLLAATLILFCALAAGAGHGDFNAIVHGVESNLGIHRTHIPLFGLASFAVGAAHPYGARQLDMAIFDDLSYSPPDSARFQAIMQSAAGGSWTPAVTVHSRRDHKWTYIYTKPDGHDMRLIIATFEPTEAAIVHLKVKPESLLRSLDEPKQAGNTLGGEQ